MEGWEGRGRRSPNKNLPLHHCLRRTVDCTNLSVVLSFQRCSFKTFEQREVHQRAINLSLKLSRVFYFIIKTKTGFSFSSL